MYLRQIKIKREINMFNFVIKTKNADGIITTREFHTASCFLAAYENNAITSFDDSIASVSYGGSDVDISKFENVDDLYHWMCSDSCDWF